VKFLILGSLEVEHSGQPVPIVGRRQHKALAMLLLHANSTVPVDRLVDALWERPPRSTRQQIHNVIGTLRRSLTAADRSGDISIVTREAGYQITLPLEALDLHRYRVLVQRAQRAVADTGPEQAVRLLQTAADLWRGPALDGLDGRYLATAADGLNEERLTTLEWLMSLRLSLGETASLISELRVLVADHPLREGLRHSLMLALYRSGRQADAFAVYEQGRKLLADELGLDPGPPLRELHQQMLSGDPGDPGRDGRPGSSRPADPPGGIRPAEVRRPARSTIPHRVRDFTGRSVELGVVLAEASASSRALAICAVDGMGGVGKTTLVLHAAHQLAEQYPDGQFYIDLQGYSTGTDPQTAAQALDVLLEGAGTPPERIPSSLVGKIALWRSEMAGRRALLVLDNAVDAAHVRPLIPSTEGLLVLVTSRRRIVDLDGAVPLSLDVLPMADAVALFTVVAGPEHTSSDPAAVEEAVSLCGRLPLAIRIAAARLRHRPGWHVSDLVDRLRTYEERTAFLTTRERSVTAVLALSYRYLRPPQQRLFRLLSLHPGVDLDVAAAAALCGLGPAETAHCLEALFEDNLLMCDVAGRYFLHDLVRDCAYGLLLDHDDAHTRRTAQHRLFDYYLAAAKLWSRDLAVGAFRFDPTVRHVPAHIPAAESDEAGMARLDAEYLNLVAVARHAAEADWPEHAWQLPCVLQPYLKRQNYGGRSLELFENAGRAARQVSSKLGESAALTGQALVYRERGPSRRALALFEAAAAITAERGDPYTEGLQLGDLAVAQVYANQIEPAYLTLVRARELARQSLAGRAEAAIVNNLGTVCRDLGRYTEALTHFRHALALHRQDGAYLPGMLTEWNIGTLSHLQGDYVTAAEVFERVLRQSRSAGFVMGETLALVALCTAYRALGRFAAALDHGRTGLHLARQFGLRELECDALDSIGETLTSVANLEAAARSFDEASDTAERHDYRRLAARALEGQAHVAAARGEEPAARTQWAEALAIYPPELAETECARTHLEATPTAGVTCARCVVVAG
jgi:DNA-binding SARP family transcriptional activator/tetratricopeptide (TPR) repeat protein